jgi:hypothetical protein
MKLDWAMLATSAEVRDSLAFVLAGGIDTLTTPALPAMFRGAVLVRMLLHPSEIEHPHNLEIKFVDEDGKQLAKLTGQMSVQANPDLPVGWSYPVMVAVNIGNLQLPRAVRYAVDILGDGQYMTTLNLRVKLAAPPA